jgi:hypothetical protein
MTESALDARSWRSFPIPGSTPDVSLTRLHVEEDKAFTTLVRFPPGWSRPGTGWYDHIEEVLFLDGAFEMSGQRYETGDYGWFPAGYVRHGSSSEGALALAWFSGPNAWSEEPSPVADGAEHGCYRARWHDLPVLASPLGGGAARLLMRGADRTSWIVEDVPAGAELSHVVELFALDERTWSRTLPDEPLPAMTGPAFCRVHDRRG